LSLTSKKVHSLTLIRDIMKEALNSEEKGMSRCGYWRWQVREALKDFWLVRSPQTPSEKDSFCRRVDAAYPFGSRKNYPYQVWLDERRQLLKFHGLVSDRPRRSRSATNSSDQLSLF
jgi:hypothetical protein